MWNIYVSLYILVLYFLKYGKVVDHEICCGQFADRSRGFGLVFDSEEVVEEFLSNGNIIDLAGLQVSTLWYCKQ